MKFSKKAQRHAKVSRKRTERMLASAKNRSGPVTISYLLGFEPQARMFRATINGRSCLVTQSERGVNFEYT